MYPVYTLTHCLKNTLQFLSGKLKLCYLIHYDTITGIPQLWSSIIAIVAACICMMWIPLEQYVVTELQHSLSVLQQYLNCILRWIYNFLAAEWLKATFVFKLETSN